MRRYNNGWTQESERHSLARRGVKTGRTTLSGWKDIAPFPIKAKGSQPIGDVWKLETPSEDYYSDELNLIAEHAISGDKKAQHFLSKLWGEKWSSVKEKLETEGSVWYVWYMDGVHELMNRDMKDKQTKEAFLRKVLGEPLTAKGVTVESFDKYEDAQSYARKHNLAVYKAGNGFVVPNKNIEHWISYSKDKSLTASGYEIPLREYASNDFYNRSMELSTGEHDLRHIPKEKRKMMVANAKRQLAKSNPILHGGSFISSELYNEDFDTFRHRGYTSDEARTLAELNRMKEIRRFPKKVKNFPKRVKIVDD